jgi:hypothetical protein
MVRELRQRQCQIDRVAETGEACPALQVIRLLLL